MWFGKKELEKEKAVVDERIGEKEKKKKEKQKGKKEEEKEKEKAAEEKEKIFPYRIVGMIEMIDTWLAKMYRVGEKEKEKEKEKDKNQKEKEKKTVKNRDFLRDEWKKRNYFGMFGMVEERKNRKKKIENFFPVIEKEKKGKGEGKGKGKRKGKGKGKGKGKRG